jgi:hypothetical protein
MFLEDRSIDRQSSGGGEGWIVGAGSSGRVERVERECAPGVGRFPLWKVPSVEGSCSRADQWSRIGWEGVEG